MGVIVTEYEIELSRKVGRIAAGRWHLLALGAQQAVQSHRGYRELRKLCDDVKSTPVLGILGFENACIRLKRLAEKASFAPEPQTFSDGLTKAAEGVVALYQAAFGDE
jgi:hypothetical protein